MADASIVISGNVVADPELRFTPSGAAVVQFSVASTPRIKTNGEWVDGETAFLRVSFWREWAEGAAEQLRKGDSVIVQGKLRQRSFEAKGGEKRTVFEVEGEFVGKSVRARKSGGGSSRVAASDDSGW